MAIRKGCVRELLKEIIETGKVAKRLGLDTVVGFTGSPIWHMLYAFPPTVSKQMIDEGFQDFAQTMETHPWMNTKKWE
jgi:hypothetical protein